MATRTETIKDHQERLNRVLEHIGRHLDEPLNLDRLAAVACFSPFHFHRIFAAHVGETVWEHVKRLRLELAAHRLTRTREATTVVYARRIGDYNQSAQEAWGAVCAFAGPMGLIGPQSEFIGLSHDDPSITPPEKLRTEIWIPVE